MTLLKLFAKITDNRRKQAKQYDSPHLLLFCLIAMLAGNNQYKDISEYIQVNLKNLIIYYPECKWKKGPAHSTINYFFQGLNIESFEKAFREYANEKGMELCRNKETNEVSLDGKVIRGSYDHSAGVKAIQVLSSYLSVIGIILGHEFIEGNKTNEIPVVQEMIETLGIENVAVTADAMHCQKKRSPRLMKRKMGLFS